MDDASTDKTPHIVNEFNDSRIRLIKNKKNLGIGKSRNKALANSVGTYIFITDADCVVTENWVSEGLKSFEKGFLGVEGRLIYVSEDFVPSYSTLFLENKDGNHYLTGSMAYRSDVIKSLGGFNEKLAWFKDRDLALRVLGLGKIHFNKSMIAIHPIFNQTPWQLLRSAERIQARVYLNKRFNEKKFLIGRIMQPFNLAKILFPPLILVSLFSFPFKSREDYNLLPFTYLFAILERYYIWKASAKYRAFFI